MPTDIQLRPRDLVLYCTSWGPTKGWVLNVTSRQGMVLVQEQVLYGAREWWPASEVVLVDRDVEPEFPSTWNDCDPADCFPGTRRRWRW